MKLNKENTIFCEKVKKMEVQALLNEIFRRLEMFIRFYGYGPKNILLNVNDYYRIKEFNKALFRKIENEEYLLCMKVIIGVKYVS